MREFKFRAWNTENEEMHMNYKAGQLFLWQDQGCPVVIMQYTGLKDINNKEIYEGDIIINDSNNYDKGDLICHDNFSIDLTPPVTVKYESEMFKAGRMSLCSFRYPLVVGNIYENSELLNLRG
ncbi:MULTISPECIES: YopX family protein [Pasteurellaceae]|uniref:YopX family protein n=1 Tax=Pasteurella atlantica TaxID=2827233 RepID=A0AAW8CMU9_9PAST|nr:YopX family protein [Pasteurella atlantica]MBR0573703.1 hypothetical protein [Pasteurella atlantica]MDP8039662.1 YopX family protein [Pasteurella atlantica]MDP8041753.1 YopX family protein [Pasteurella atlantica]MDP8043973.1 YopX family protein [Pasteurella atlantica]MDP8045951.1 YopX family protein [Pasteurella atlantica]